MCAHLKCVCLNMNVCVRAWARVETETLPRYGWNFLLVTQTLMLSQHFLCSTKFPSPLEIGQDPTCSIWNIQSEVISRLKPQHVSAKLSCVSYSGNTTTLSPSTYSHACPGRVEFSATLHVTCNLNDKLILTVLSYWQLEYMYHCNILRYLHSF